MSRNTNTHKRRGAVAVEFAFVLPVLFIFFFGLWEWSRVEMIKHVTETAVFTGARHGTLPGATVEEMEQISEDILSMYFIKNSDISADIDVGNDEATVEISVPLDENLWISSQIFAGKSITAEMVFKK